MSHYPRFYTWLKTLARVCRWAQTLWRRSNPDRTTNIRNTSQYDGVYYNTISDNQTNQHISYLIITVSSWVTFSLFLELLALHHGFLQYMEFAYVAVGFPQHNRYFFWWVKHPARARTHDTQLSKQLINFFNSNKSSFVPVAFHLE